jgi:magnesium transporter
MIRTMLCTEAYRARHRLDRAAVGVVLADEQDLLWLDLEVPTAAELSLLSEQFAFHELALEDAARPHQRPKIDRYDGMSFIVCYDIDWLAAEGRVDAHELAIFAGKNFLVTVHFAPIAEIAEVAARFHANAAQLERGAGTLLYHLLDTIVDHYFPVVDGIGTRIAELERRIFANRERQGVQDTFALRKELIALRQAIAPQREVLDTLARRELPLVGAAVAPYFQDVGDHLVRVADAIDGYRDLLDAIFDAYQLLNAESTNRVIKTMTAYTIILMVVTLIAGIYGMNFAFMPELGARRLPRRAARDGPGRPRAARLLPAPGLALSRGAHHAKPPRRAATGVLTLYVKPPSPALCGRPHQADRALPETR